MPHPTPSPGRWARIKAWWLPAGHMPWNAALASLLLASVVTLVWRDEDTPGAEPEAPPAQPAATAPGVVPVPKGPSAPKLEARSNSGVRRESPREPPAAPVSRTRLPDQADAVAADAAPLVASPLLTTPTATAPPAVIAAPAEVRATAPAPSAMRVAPAAKAAESPGRAESAGAPGRAPSVTAAEAWTLLRVTSAGTLTVVRRSSSPGWAGVIRRVLAVAVTPTPLDGAPVLQIDLLQGEVALGRLALFGTWACWSPTGGDSLAGELDAAVLRDLQALLPDAPTTPADSAR